MIDLSTKKQMVYWQENLRKTEENICYVVHRSIW